MRSDFYSTWEFKIKDIVLENITQWLENMGSQTVDFILNAQIENVYFDQQKLLNIILKRDQMVWNLKHLYVQDLPMLQGYKINDTPFNDFFGLSNKEYTFFIKQLDELNFVSFYNLVD
ncbi:hypothetical protein MH215_10170 [Paenibacillus sp. ACRSA]|uniref:hypothetical protein n=1 Tax=Paenibacillus sp. ACRSA TaxID=2918211 RepID=UPI001EF565E0|nr:hypothetical protein [Paenibacillus sp. ACRSA]MCG7377361.1 hypothetical protein [Paenibacillus sp. ACRSA]